MKRFVSRIVSGAVMLCITFAGIPAIAQTSSPAESLKSYNIYADLNQNGKADAGDALAILEASVGKKAFSDEQKEAGDLNGDGGITAVDALLDLRYVVGELSFFASGEKTASRVVYPEGCSEYVLDAAQRLQSLIYDHTGAELPLVSDKETEAAGDISVGITNRSAVSLCLPNMPQNGFAVKEQKGQLAVCSYTDESLKTAAEYLFRYLAGAGRAAFIKKGFASGTTFEDPQIVASDITVCGNSISEFTVTAEQSSLDEFSKVISGKIKSVTGKEPAISSEKGEKSIFISTSLASGENERAIKIEVSENEIIIAASAHRMTDAVRFFCRNVLGFDNLKNGKIVVCEKDSYVGDVITNPSTAGSCPDPFVKYVDGYYYAMFTEATRLVLYRSRNLSTLTTDEYKVVYNGGENVIKSDIWAPEFYFDRNQNKWYIYSNGTLTPGNFNTQRMFCLESDTSELWGNYHFKGLLDSDNYCIDASPYYNEHTGVLYLTYVSVGGGYNRLDIAKMDNPWTMNKGSKTAVSVPQYDWELKVAKINEGGCFVEQNGKLYLAFSANSGDTKAYCVGLIEFTGDYKKDDLNDKSKWKKLERPLIKSGGGIYGPGHNSFFLSPDGSELWIAYHGRTDPVEVTWFRPLCFQKVELDGNGDFVMDTTPALAGTYLKQPSAKNDRR